MAFIRNCLLTVSFAFWFSQSKAQTVSYPAQSSQLLKATAEDVAMLLQKAIAGSTFTAQQYSILPSSGFIFIYDSTITDNQACKIEGNGASLVKFSALQDNGLCFGVYQYLQQLGFRFYQPGSIWEIIPSLTSVYRNINATITSSFKYKTWNISGGHNRWAMDNNNNYSWDAYFGDNGHNWALYQRRNGMTGAYRFGGHRSDVMNGSYLSTLQNNPCYVACYEGSRQANTQSVPDINSNAAMQLWSGTLEQKYTQYKNTVFGNANLYSNLYRNFSYYNDRISIEVPDGAQWGNSKDYSVCSNIDYPKESDQQFSLANFTALQLNNAYPGKRFQLYAYSSHADVPSSNIAINASIDVQVVPGAFQNESSAKGLLNRWYGKTNNLSEYHYLNIPQWGGETPMFYLDEVKTTLQRLKEKNSQGIMWEASPAKFASLPFLLAANSNLLSNASVDSSLHSFCDDMFGAANNTIYKLLQLWSNDKTITMGDFIADNKYKNPLYFQWLNDAVSQTQNAALVVKERIAEMKAYMHYMVLYYDWLFDQRTNTAKAAKAATLCTYLARINKMQLVNSYFIIADITSRYDVNSVFYQQYNIANGTAYQNGNLPLITAAEIENNFTADYNAQSNLINQYKLEDAAFMQSQFNAANITALKKIFVKLSYTNGAGYPGRSEYYINAPQAGSFTIKYFVQYQMPGKGYVNFTVEAVDKALQVIKDFSIGRRDAPDGTFTVNLPAAGTYKLSVVSKYKSTTDVTISTNGNYFYKNAPFLGNKTENYRTNLLSLPGYFYIPNGISKVYFSVNNSNPGGNGFATPDAISKAFVFRDNFENTIQPKLVNTNDSSLFYLDVPALANGTFWHVYKMEQYNLCFTNISNITWFAETKPCSNANFTASIIKKYNDCITKLTASSSSASNLHWEIYDLGRWTYYSNQTTVELPNYTSPNAVITLKNGSNCTVTKRLGDDDKYLKSKEACGSGAPIAAVNGTPVLYPNPSNGIFNCMQNGSVAFAEEIMVTNAQGLKLCSYKDVKQFNISNVAAGVYWYRMTVNGEQFKGKIIKM